MVDVSYKNVSVVNETMDETKLLRVDNVASVPWLIAFIVCCIVVTPIQLFIAYYSLFEINYLQQDKIPKKVKFFAVHFVSILGNVLTYFMAVFLAAFAFFSEANIAVFQTELNSFWLSIVLLVTSISQNGFLTVVVLKRSAKLLSNLCSPDKQLCWRFCHFLICFFNLIVNLASLWCSILLLILSLTGNAGTHQFRSLIELFNETLYRSLFLLAGYVLQIAIGYCIYMSYCHCCVQRFRQSR
jgi:hypothetical protein